MSEKKASQFKLWQFVAFKSFFKRRMKPLTVSQVYRYKFYLSCCYLLFSGFVFHRILLYKFDENYQGPDEEIRRAVNLNIPQAKIIKFENGKLKEIVDYDRDDYPEYVNNRPSYARE